MSTLYNLEPQPTAKVILHTSSGDISLELFAKQTPLASRNFLQHCLDGYYDNTIFHRLVPGFIVQGGDPTGTGHGGISAINNGDPFPDEFHSRLKFNRRGLLGSANEGRDSNGSQFFLTLGVTAELQGKHTMFGRIEGDTIYNLMKIGEAELAEGTDSDRPLYPTKITRTEILLNPFDDMVPRVRTAPRVVDDASKKDVKKRKKPAGKNVLSFGDDGEEEDMTPITKKTKFNPKLVSVGIDEQPETTPIIPKRSKKAKAKATEIAEVDEEQPAEKEQNHANSIVPDEVSHADSDEDEDKVRQEQRSRELDRTNAEIAALKASMKRTSDHVVKDKPRPVSALEAMIPASSTRGRKRGKVSDEKGAFDMFKAFKTRLEDMPVEADSRHENATTKEKQQSGLSASMDAEDEEAGLCDLHFIANCQSCQSWDDTHANGDTVADDDDADGAWMSHRLTFAKDTLGKDLEWKKKMEEIEVIDPREKARTIQDERRKEKTARRK